MNIFLRVIGIVLKINANHRYISTGYGNALFRLLCHEAEVPFQEFVMRNDLACGSTIGPTTSASLGVNGVDIGIASLAMHSVREYVGTLDPYYMNSVLTHFINRQDLPQDDGRTAYEVADQ